METETKTQAAQSPAPGAESAPAQTPAAPVTQAAPEIAAKPPVTQAVPKEPKDFFQARETKREKKAQERLPELEKRIAELQSQLENRKPVETPEPVSFLDDPEKAIKQAEENATRRAVETIKGEQEESQRQSDYVKATDEAKSFLLTRSHLKEDPNARNEIADILEANYEDLARYEKGQGKPGIAAKLAYIDWCQQKGVVPDIDGLPKTSNQGSGGKTSAGVSPSAPAAGERTWNRREAEAYLMESTKNPAQFKSRSAEIEKAKSEGRVK